MPVINTRTKGNCKYDCISLGEVMLRFDPGEGRIKTAREFKVWEGGGEYNVTRGLRKCFGMNVAVISALADNDIGRLIEDLIMQGGVDVSLIKWVPYDGIGRTARNGLNFTERGFGIRGALGVPDRANTAASQIQPFDFDWDFIFGIAGVRWLHTGGIFTALSRDTAKTAVEAVKKAKQYGVAVSYDFNYRPSLWRTMDYKDEIIEANIEIMKNVDVVIGNINDFKTCLNFDFGNLCEDSNAQGSAEYKKIIDELAKVYKNIKVAATTIRNVKSATINDWSAMCWSGGKIYKAKQYDSLEILDRVGGGDAFAGGLIYGLMTSDSIQTAVEYGAAHGALAMTTPGDTSMASLKEVESLMNGAGKEVQR